MKTLYLDFENGYKSLGSKEDICELFGYPMLQYDTWSDFGSLISKLYEQATVKAPVKIGNLSIPQSVTKWVPTNGTQLDVLVLDTMTELVKKFQRELAKDRNGKNTYKLTLPQWGEMKLRIDMVLSTINSVPNSVICNVHGKLKEDNELGVLKVMPNIEGSTKEDLGKWFDFVLYTQVSKDSKGNRTYQWITARDEKYCQAKDRSQELPKVMDQDYSIIFDIVKKKGWDGAKILVIGDPGSGKTMSLKTIKGANNA